MSGMTERSEPKDVVCPRCGGPAKPIVYGLPGPELQQQATAGEVLLGGCCIDADSPEFGCVRCGFEWSPTDESSAAQATTGNRFADSPALREPILGDHSKPDWEAIDRRNESLRDRLKASGAQEERGRSGTVIRLYGRPKR